MFNPNCKYYEKRHGKMFGSCNHLKMRGWFFKKLCIRPDKECPLQELMPVKEYYRYYNGFPPVDKDLICYVRDL